MGLDQYLFKRNPERVSNPDAKDELIGQWRKFNALHRYINNFFALDFPDDNCKELDLSSSKVRVTLADLYSVKEKLDAAERIYDPDQTDEEKEIWWTYPDEVQEEVAKILPPSPGFFFGSLDIDSGYYQDVVHSIKIFEKALSLIEHGADVYYYAWY